MWLLRFPITLQIRYPYFTSMTGKLVLKLSKFTGNLCKNYRGLAKNEVKLTRTLKNRYLNWLPCLIRPNWKFYYFLSLVDMSRKYILSNQSFELISSSTSQFQNTLCRRWMKNGNRWRNNILLNDFIFLSERSICTFLLRLFVS